MLLWYSSLLPFKLEWNNVKLWPLVVLFTVALQVRRGEMDEDEMERQMEEAIAKKYEALAKNKSPNVPEDGEKPKATSNKY